MKILIASGAGGGTAKGRIGKHIHLKDFGEALVRKGVEYKLVYENDYVSGFPSKNIKSWFSKKKFYLEGRGQSQRNFIESYDFANGIYLTIKKGVVKNKYHFSSNKFYSIKKIVQIIYSLKSENFNKFVKYTKERKGKDQAYKLDCKKTIKSLGWKPKVSLINSLKKIKIFYEQNFIKLKKLDSIYKDKNFLNK